MSVVRRTVGHMSNAVAFDIEQRTTSPVLAVVQADPDCPECGESLEFYESIAGSRPLAYERCGDCGVVLLAD
jgi:hypothetical protein